MESQKQLLNIVRSKIDKLLQTVVISSDKEGYILGEDTRYLLLMEIFQNKPLLHELIAMKQQLMILDKQLELKDKSLEKNYNIDSLRLAGAAFLKLARQEQIYAERMILELSVLMEKAETKTIIENQLLSK